MLLAYWARLKRSILRGLAEDAGTSFDRYDLKGLCRSVSPRIADTRVVEKHAVQTLMIGIKDADPAAVEAMLQYIYTSELPESCDLPEIFSLASRYDLADLF